MKSKNKQNIIISPPPGDQNQSSPIEKVSFGLFGLTLRYEGPNGFQKAKGAIFDLFLMGTGFLGLRYGLKYGLPFITWYLKNDISRKKGWVKDSKNLKDPKVLTEEITSTSSPMPVHTETINDGINRAKTNGICLKRINGPIRPGDILVIAGCTGHGKSILATQLGLECASGKSSQLFADGVNHESQQIPQSVVLYDAEQDDEDILERYGKHDVKYPSNFERLKYGIFESADDVLEDIKVRAFTMHEAGHQNLMFVLDNITSFFTTMSHEKTRKFYFGLKQIQKQVQKIGGILTIVVLTHMTKIEDHISVEKKHINGCANMSNFATLVWSIRPTRMGKEYWMLKTLKQRRGVPIDTVLLLKLHSEPYVHFEFEDECDETDLLPEIRKSKKEALCKCDESFRQSKNPEGMKPEEKQKMMELVGEGYTQQQISDILGYSRKTISKHLNRERRRMKN